MLFKVQRGQANSMNRLAVSDKKILFLLPMLVGPKDLVSVLLSLYTTL